MMSLAYKKWATCQLRGVAAACYDMRKGDKTTTCIIYTHSLWNRQKSQDMAAQPPNQLHAC